MKKESKRVVSPAGGLIYLKYKLYKSISAVKKPSLNLFNKSDDAFSNYSESRGLSVGITAYVYRHYFSQILNAELTGFFVYL